MRTRPVRLGAALLTSTAIGLGGVEIAANLSARTELARFLATHPGTTVGSIVVEPFTGRTRLHELRFGAGDTTIAIETFDLQRARSGFALIDPAEASPFDDNPDDKTTAKPEEAAPAKPAADEADTGGNAHAENITITKGATTFKIKRIDATGTTLSNADLATLLDPNGSGSWETRLKKLNATTISMPEILIDNASGDFQRQVTLTQVAATGATAGKLATASIGPSTFTFKNDEKGSDGGIDGAQSSNIDLAQLAHVFGTVRSDESEPIRPIYDSVTVTGLTINDTKKTSTVKLATLKETGLKGRALKTDFLASPQGVGASKLTDEQQAAVLQDFQHSFAIGSLETTGLEGRGNGTDVFSLASLTVRDLGDAKVGGFSLAKLRFDGPTLKMGIGSVDIGPFALPPPKSGLPTAQDANAMVPSKANVDISQIDFDLVSTDTDGPKRVQFKVAHVGLVSDGEPGDLPKTAKTNVDNVTFDVPSPPGQAQPLYDMGYRHLDMSMGVATTYDAVGQSLMIHDLTLNGAGMGSLALGLHLMNVTKGLVSPNQEVVKASALAILAKGISLDVVNDGLVDKAIAWKATQDGISTDKERAALIDYFDTQLPALVNQNANAKLVGGAVAKFIAAPKNLHISIESKSGLGVGSMGLLSDPNLLLDTLDVKAAANQ